MSQYKLLPSYTDLTSLSLDCGLGGHTTGPVIFSAAVGGDRLLGAGPRPPGDHGAEDCVCSYLVPGSLLRVYANVNLAIGLMIGKLFPAQARESW